MDKIMLSKIKMLANNANDIIFREIINDGLHGTIS